ncbi:Hypothetical protein PAU_03620 [Photorhabdus asymbiotica]|uniref:Uncharacterized protein n=1 Tax=Photorhabdus asymbiotica subsp. asymbiotica (strain ATCC 43949 / 3105-77) TaxID=553480 RepID=C7BL33_PHOAA|nr:Hypothetical protein PAU_03620 [Photorhabdus asymbiotica]
MFIQQRIYGQKTFDYLLESMNQMVAIEKGENNFSSVYPVKPCYI